MPAIYGDLGDGLLLFYNVLPTLVGGFNPSEKYSSVGMIIPNIWKNKKMFQTTNQHMILGSTF